MTTTEWIPGDPLFGPDSCWNREIFDLLPDDGSLDHSACIRCRNDKAFTPHHQHVTPEEAEKILKTCMACGCEHSIACPTMHKWDW